MFPNYLLTTSRTHHKFSTNVSSANSQVAVGPVPSALHIAIHSTLTAAQWPRSCDQRKPCYQRRNWGPKRWRNLPQVAQLGTTALALFVELRALTCGITPCQPAWQVDTRCRTRCPRPPESSQEGLLGGDHVLLDCQDIRASFSDAPEQACWRENRSRHTSDLDGHRLRIVANHMSLHSLTLIRKDFGWSCNLSSRVTFLSPA